ncbi:MAG: PEP-CTERM sorting domain-containing protein, partial [Myxococcota bacterium]|nr:PEP-CTERM sorting domain-containing protein [Myxococcota bacterium]
WHYTPAGGGKVKMGTNGRLLPVAEPLPPPGRVAGAYGFFGTSKTGDGNPALVGTVTIQADATGAFHGGGFQMPGVDGFLGSSATGLATVIGGQFTVVPEPGTALLLGAGLSGLAIAGRRKR